MISVDDSIFFISVNGRSNFNCPECDNTFDTERELNIHHGTVHGGKRIIYFLKIKLAFRNV